MNTDDNIFSEKDCEGLTDALKVARTGNRSTVTDGDEKLLRFFLRHGECDAWITEKPAIEVIFSWMSKRKPSTYFASLAPGLVSQLMDLGGIESISDFIEFSVGPGTSGTNRYLIAFNKKWVWISCSDDEIRIRVRDKRSSLKVPLRSEKTKRLTIPATEQVGAGGRSA
jgi:hypothetical protein